MPYSYELAQHGKTLATRPFGERLRGKLIQEAGESEEIVLDFSGVLSASHSFLDEFVAQLAEEARAGDRPFRVTVSGASREVEDVLDRALERRGVQLAHSA